MAARGLVNGRGPRSGRDLVFRCYPPELLYPPQKKQKLTFWVSLFVLLLVYLGILAVGDVLEFAVVAPFADDSVH